MAKELQSTSLVVVTTKKDQKEN